MVRWTDQVIFYLICVLNLIPVFMFALCLFEGLFMLDWAFRKELYGFCETSLFFGNSRQHMAVCAKMGKIISTWERKVLSMAMTHESMGTLQGAVTSTTLVAGMSLVPTLLAGDWARVASPVEHYFFNIYHYYRLAPGSCAACCPGP